MARPGDGVSCEPELLNELRGDEGVRRWWIKRAEYAVGIRMGAGNSFDIVGFIGVCAFGSATASCGGGVF